MRPLLCFSRARLCSGLLRLSLLGSYVTLRGGLVLLGLAFLLHRLIPSYGPDSFLGSALHVFRDAFGACLGSRLICHDRLPIVSPCSGAPAPPSGTARYPAIGGINAYLGSETQPPCRPGPVRERTFSGYLVRWPRTSSGLVMPLQASVGPALLAFAADAGSFAALGGEDVGVAGMGVAPA